MERLLNVNIKRKTGFTLVELLIVVAIIGLLAAIAVPSYNDYVTRTKITNMINAADQIKTQVSEYRNVNGNFDGIIPGDTETTLTNIGASDPTLMTPTISSIEFTVQDEEHMAFAICGSSAGQGTATDDTVDIYFTGTVLTANTLGATANAGGMTWGCAYEGNGKYVPSSCRTLYDPGTYGTLANTCVH